MCESGVQVTWSGLFRFDPGRSGFALLCGKWPTVGAAIAAIPFRRSGVQMSRSGLFRFDPGRSGFRLALRQMTRLHPNNLTIKQSFVGAVLAAISAKQPVSSIIVS
jgi:hypothetical protein